MLGTPSVKVPEIVERSAGWIRLPFLLLWQGATSCWALSCTWRPDHGADCRVKRTATLVAAVVGCCSGRVRQPVSVHVLGPHLAGRFVDEQQQQSAASTRRQTCRQQWGAERLLPCITSGVHISPACPTGATQRRRPPFYCRHFQQMDFWDFLHAADGI